MATGCPCGAHVAPGYDEVTDLSQDLLDTLVNSAELFAKYKWLLVAWIGVQIGAYLLCASPREQMPEMELADWLNLQTGQLKIGQAIRSMAYPILCECDDCPPITDCGEGATIVVCPEDGYLTDPPLLDRRYHIPTGSDLWVANTATCLGNKNGIWVYWYYDAPGDALGHVNVRAGDDGGPGDTWYVPDDGIGPCVSISFGGEQTPSVEPWPEAPGEIIDYPGPPSCTPDDICTALDFVYKAVNDIRFLAMVAAGPLYGVTSTIRGTFPNGAGEITGTVFDALPRMLEAIAPILPSQLTNPQTVVVTESGVVDVSDVAYVNVVPTTVPASLGYRGADDNRVYYSNHRTPGPGWIVALGTEGVLWHRELLYPGGNEFAIPAGCSDLAIYVSAGVELEVHTWEREV